MGALKKGAYKSAFSAGYFSGALDGPFGSKKGALGGSLGQSCALLQRTLAYLGLYDPYGSLECPGICVRFVRWACFLPSHRVAACVRAC